MLHFQTRDSVLFGIKLGHKYSKDLTLPGSVRHPVICAGGEEGERMRGEAAWDPTGSHWIPLDPAFAATIWKQRKRAGKQLHWLRQEMDSYTGYKWAFQGCTHRGVRNRLEVQHQHPPVNNRTVSCLYGVFILAKWGKVSM